MHYSTGSDTPEMDRHRRHNQILRRRLVVVAAAVTVMALLLLGLTSSNGHDPTALKKKATTKATVSAPATGSAEGAIPAVEAGVLPWSFHVPLSRETVLPGGNGSLLVVGGLNQASATIGDIVSLDLKTGNETALGALATGVHDSAGAVIGNNVTVFAGGSPAAVATVQQFPAPPGAGIEDPAPATWTSSSGVPGTAPVVITGQVTMTTATTPVHSTAVASLPQARADQVSVTVGGSSYVIGGYDGTNPTPQILATTDGVHFRVAGQLAIPVRYPAVATLGGKIYLFGGEAVGGSADGTAIANVQVFDPHTGKITMPGSLPAPVAGASAFALEGHLYLAGGVGNLPAAPGTPAKLSNMATDAVLAWNSKTNMGLTAGKLPVPVAFAGSAVTFGRAWLVGGETAGTPVASVEMVVPNKGFGTAGAAGAGSPYFGYKLLIADRGNDRLEVLTPGDQPAWTYPSVFAAAPPGGFYFPDDAFFAKGGTEIVSNQERNHTLVIISFPSGQLLWQYGHPLVLGAAPGYLSWPDDAYVLKDGEVTVADDRNCRILFISPAKTITAQIGTTGICAHKPPTEIASPNGDTPLADGNYLVSEIDGQWISEYTRSGQLIWTTHLDMHYPSDPQQLGSDLYLVSDYAITPGGAIDEFNREGQILYRLQPTSGITRMNQNSLAELIPSGVFMTNDDYRDRMTAYDPPTGALVWQYGVADKPGTAPGYLNTPDGFDLLAADGTTPTHPFTG
ncbi:MAG: PQQ-binding-like beta-propeller repeat protein [Acidimicrobiales bacterium]